MPCGQGVGFATAGRALAFAAGAALDWADDALGAAVTGGVFARVEALGSVCRLSSSQEANMTSRHQGANRTALAYSIIQPQVLQHHRQRGHRDPRCECNPNRRSAELRQQEQHGRKRSCADGSVNGLPRALSFGRAKPRPRRVAPPVAFRESSGPVPPHRRDPQQSSGERTRSNYDAGEPNRRVPG